MYIELRMCNFFVDEEWQGEQKQRLMKYQLKWTVRVLLIIPCTLIDFLYLECYFLMFWAGEAKVSIHKEHELKGHDFNVGSTASCRFGKVFYDGRIAGIGKK